jgi:ribonuclease PH
MRPDGRRPDQLRPISIEPGAVPYAEGSALVCFGDTRVLCAASVEERVPPYRKGTGSGWITAEYSMLPRSTQVRTERDARRGRIDGRASEIQRLIGRSLRAAVEMDAMGERTIIIDCDVLQADGGTRTASITGGFVALALACRRLVGKKLLAASPLLHEVAAVSVGIVDGEARLDLPYLEDAAAEVDMNIVMTADGKLVEVQGTAEHGTFDRQQLDTLVDLATAGIEQLIAAQRRALEGARA